MAEHKFDRVEYDARKTAGAQVSNDTLATYLKAHTLEEIETYVAGQFSALAGMTPTAIDNYLDTNVVDLATAKSVLKVLAKDLAQTMVLLQITTKIAAYTVKQEL